MIDFVKGIDGIAYVVYIIVIIFFILALIGFLSERNKKIELSLNDDELNNDKNKNLGSALNTNINSVSSNTSVVTNVSNTPVQQSTLVVNNNKNDVGTSIPMQSQISSQLNEVANNTQNNQVNNSINEVQGTQPIITINNTSNN